MATTWPVPDEFELVGVQDNGNDAVEEAALHAEYASARVHGEWFYEFKEGDLPEFLKSFGVPTPLGGVLTIEPGEQPRRFWRGVKPRELRNVVWGRYLAIAVRYRKGDTMAEIAEQEGCSRQRIHQILKKCREKVASTRRGYGFGSEIPGEA